jgi:hypothetical protein
VPARCISIACANARTMLWRASQQHAWSAPAIPPTAAGQLALQLPSQYQHLPASAVASKLVHTCSNHFKASINACTFHPQSSRVVTGNRIGELAIWDLHNGFNFVKQFSAHQGAKINAMRWSHHEQYCLTGDSEGIIKCEPLQCTARYVPAAAARDRVTTLQAHFFCDGCVAGQSAP